jgi:hypothetical protein
MHCRRPSLIFIGCSTAQRLAVVVSHHRRVQSASEVLIGTADSRREILFHYRLQIRYHLNLGMIVTSRATANVSFLVNYYKQLFYRKTPRSNGRQRHRQESGCDIECQESSIPIVRDVPATRKGRGHLPTRSSSARAGRAS